MNEEGACQTYGDSNSDYFIDILRKYFVYTYEDVQTVKILSPNLVNWVDLRDSGRYAFEWILSQDGIDKSLF